MDLGRLRRALTSFPELKHFRIGGMVFFMDGIDLASISQTCPKLRGLDLSAEIDLLSMAQAPSDHVFQNLTSLDVYDYVFWGARETRGNYQLTEDAVNQTLEVIQQVSRAFQLTHSVR